MWPARWGGSRSNRGQAPRFPGAGLTNTIAIWLGLVIVAAIVADLAVNSGAAFQFLARKFLNLIDWVAFWN